MTAWHTENFSRAGKTLKDLREYLKPAVDPEQQRERGARNLREMIQRMRVAKERQTVAVA